MSKKLRTCIMRWSKLKILTKIGPTKTCVNKNLNVSDVWIYWQKKRKKSSEI